MLLQLSSGRGPVECEIAVGLYANYLLQQYSGAVVEKKQAGIAAQCDLPKGVEPLKSALVYIPDGNQAQTGIVQWICQSPVRKGHKRKNWFIEVAILDASSISKPAVGHTLAISGNQYSKVDLSFETFRSPGKGGQNVNKVETGVRVTHLPTGLTASSVTARTQLANKKLAIGRLQQKLSDLAQQSKREQQNRQWGNHNQLERGNAVAVFSGLDFVRILRPE